MKLLSPLLNLSIVTLIILCFGFKLTCSASEVLHQDDSCLNSTHTSSVQEDEELKRRIDELKCRNDIMKMDMLHSKCAELEREKTKEEQAENGWTEFPEGGWQHGERKMFCGDWVVYAE